MSTFRVTPEHVGRAADGLRSISGQVIDVQMRLGGHAGAGTGTPAAGAIDALTARWSRQLPLYGLSAARLHSALDRAAEEYQQTDAVVARAAQPDRR
ncbi:MAG TPA: hypothetical protein VGG07_07070 [Solirubrobacteraceae bacterium]|jgi:hypothetical protein